MKIIDHFMLPEHTNSLYKNEAISSVSLTREIADKINEIVDSINTLSQMDLEWKQTQEGTIRKGVLYMKDNLLNSLNDLLTLFRDSGYIDDRIEYHCRLLQQQLDNLLGSVKTGSTSLDAELLDIRVAYDGSKYSTAGNSVRNQFSLFDKRKVDKTDTIKPHSKTENLLLEDWFVKGHYYSAEGIFAENPNAGYYPLVEVTPNTLYSYYGCQILVMFDENMNVTGADTEFLQDFKQITTTATTKYIAVSKSTNFSFKSGLYLGEYSGAVKDGERLLSLEQIHGMTSLVQDIINSVKGTVGKNLFNKNSSSIVSGKYILYLDGSIGENDNYSYDLIAVEPLTTYTVNSNANEHIVFFDANDSFISGTSTNLGRTFTTPENVAYMSFSYRTANADSLQIEKGSSSTSYSSYEHGVSADTLNNNSVTFEKLSQEVKNAIGSAKKIVTIGAGKDYDSIARAISENGENTIFKIYRGTYDIEAEYLALYGEDYFSNYEGYSSSGLSHDRGLNLSKGCELLGVGDVKIIFNYTGDNETVKRYFAPINTTSDNTVDNISIHITDGCCRYHIHDDFASEPGLNHFSRISFYGDPSLHTAIGGGMGTDNVYIIESCFFENAGSLSITYHNNVNSGVNKLIVKDCHCDGGIRAAHYGTSTEKTKFMVSNCKATSVFVVFGDEANFPNENIELIAWNNVTD